VRRAQRNAFVLGAIGLVSSLVGWITMPREFPHAWLAALTCWLTWALGSLGLVLIHALTGGRWGHLVRRPLAAGVATLPLLLPLLAPVLVAGRRLYPWMEPGLAAHLDNSLYLNVPFFYVRTIVYAGVWLALGAAVLRAMRGAGTERRLARIAPAGLILLALTVTFASLDYTLSLEPSFASSVYGWLACSEALLLALSVALIGPCLTAADRAAVRPLARLLLGLTLLWAYLDFMQLLIVWNSDLPREADWYARRLTGFWGGLAAAVALGHFALPFVALIWAPVQRSARVVAGVAAVLVLAELPRVWWIVIPAGRRGLDWIDAAAMLGVLGLAAGIALRALRRLPDSEGGARAGA
jgi:hypothetical protein